MIGRILDIDRKNKYYKVRTIYGEDLYVGFSLYMSRQGLKIGNIIRFELEDGRMENIHKMNSKEIYNAWVALKTGLKVSL